MTPFEIRTLSLQPSILDITLPCLATTVTVVPIATVVGGASMVVFLVPSLGRWGERSGRWRQRSGWCSIDVTRYTLENIPFWEHCWCFDWMNRRQNRLRSIHCMGRGCCCLLRRRDRANTSSCKILYEVNMYKGFWSLFVWNIIESIPTRDWLWPKTGFLFELVLTWYKDEARR